MNDEANLAEAATPTGTTYTNAVNTVGNTVVVTEQTPVDIAPTPPEWKKVFGDLQAMNTQAGALVQHKAGLTFIYGCHVSDVGIFQLDNPAAPVRRLGRPKGSKNKSATAKRGPGRPKAKKLGRPKGSKNKAKRGPGRPKGSKNKK